MLCYFLDSSAYRKAVTLELLICRGLVCIVNSLPAEMATGFSSGGADFAANVDS